MKKTLFFIILSFVTNYDIIGQNISESTISNAETFENEQITGDVFKHVFRSKILNNTREIFVWVPPDYNLNK